MVNKINPYKVESIKKTGEIVKRNFANIATKKTIQNIEEPEKSFSVYLDAAIQRIKSRNQELKELKLQLSNPKSNINEVKQLIASLNRGNIDDRIFLKSNGIKDLNLLGQNFDFWA